MKTELSTSTTEGPVKIGDENDLDATMNDADLEAFEEEDEGEKTARGKSKMYDLVKSFTR